MLIVAVEAIVNTTTPTVIDGLPTVNSTTVTETVQVGLHPFVDGEVLQVAPETITIAPSCNQPHRSTGTDHCRRVHYWSYTDCDG